MDRSSAIREVWGLDQGNHADRGTGPYDDTWIRGVLRALGVTDAEISEALEPLRRFMQ